MQLKSVKRFESLSKSDFNENFLTKNEPVVLTRLTSNWPAIRNWTYDYFKQHAGDIVVPVYDNSIPKPGDAVNAPDGRMKFGEYLDLIATTPTELRIFLFNIFHHIPSITKDFNYFHELCGGFLEKYPMMFFGGAGSKVYLHYDMDMSHVFTTQFRGRKKVILFKKEYSDALYQLPFTVQSYIDPEQPDYAKHPALRDVEGYETTLEDGETLFMPAGMWHYMNYLEGGFALSLRSMDTSIATKLEGLFNLFVIRNLDTWMKRIAPVQWHNYKQHKSVARAMEFIYKQQSGVRESVLLKL